MAESKLNDIIQTSLSHIKELTDVSTVVGEQIETKNGTVIIPISKVSVGFVSGGVDYYGKRKKEEGPAPKAVQANFGGGGGTGLTIQPVGFLVIKPNGDVNMLPVTQASSGQAADIAMIISNFIEKTPGLIEEFKATLGKTEVFKDVSNAAAEQVGE